MTPSEQLVEAIDNNDNRAAIALIRSEPAIIHEYLGDEQAIHSAVRSGSEEIVRELLLAGADVNAQGSNGETPIHYAIRARNIDMVRLLLSRTPDLSKENDAGISPLLLAARSGESEMADELLDAGAKMDFHSAVALGRAEVARKILHQNPDAIRTVRHKNDLLPDAIYANSVEAVALLLQSPEIDVHTYGLSGEFPLMAAVSSSAGNPEIVKLLLQHGADPSRADRRGQTAIDRARRVGTLQWLQQ